MIQRRVSSLSVVEDLDVVKNTDLGLGPGVEGPEVNELFFQRTEERLHDRIVEAISFAAHALMYLPGIQYAAHSVAGILAASI